MCPPMDLHVHPGRVGNSKLTLGRWGFLARSTLNNHQNIKLPFGCVDQSFTLWPHGQGLEDVALFS